MLSADKQSLVMIAILGLDSQSG